ncbi:46150_t:CDS:1, partial [Gigaspora margarita]
VFVNDSWTCASPIERPYYSAGIYPDICYNCGSAEDLKKTKGELPLCSKCTGVTIPKKRFKWKQGSKKKGSHAVRKKKRYD